MLRALPGPNELMNSLMSTSSFLCSFETLQQQQWRRRQRWGQMFDQLLESQKALSCKSADKDIRRVCHNTHAHVHPSPQLCPQFTTTAA
jgi:hypothetical protein